MRRLLPLLLSPCRIKQRLCLIISLVLLLLFVIGKLTSFRHCVHYLPVYLRSFSHGPSSMHGLPMCSFCKDVSLHLSCYEAAIHFPSHRCMCNCASFTHTKKTKYQNLTILFLSSYERYTTQMLRIEFDYYQAAQVDPHINAHLWGEGFAGYNPHISLKRNLQKRHPGVKFDAIFIQTPPKFRFSQKIYVGLKEISDETVVIFRFHECRYGICEPHVLDTGASIALFAYARDIQLYPHLRKDTLMVHLPHVVHTPLFKNVSHLSPNRKTSVLLTGRLASAYPFRTRLHYLLEDHKIEGASSRKHPTYTMANSKTASLKVIEKQEVDYIRSLESAKIVLVTASRGRLRLIKYGEAAVAGALIVGNIPLGSEYEFKNIMVEIKPEFGNNKILKILEHYLSNPDERAKIVSQARELFLNKYTTYHFLEWLQDVLTLHRHGARGTYHPYYYIPLSEVSGQSCLMYYSSEAWYEVANLFR